jgi:hypothetical protein
MKAWVIHLETISWPSDWTARDWKIIFWGIATVALFTVALLGWQFLVGYLKSHRQSFLYRVLIGPERPPHRPHEPKDDKNDRA